MADALERYNQKRDFTKTAEPEGKLGDGSGFRYLIQKHAATRLHYDFRLELDGVLKSWAVTRGPSLNPDDKRLAVETEDHPVSYGSFEGIIPKGQYGGGTVMMWDEGTWAPLEDPHKGLKDGNLKFRLHGQRLTGDWALVRMKPRPQDKGRSNWLLIKHRDEVSTTDDAESWLETLATSIVSGRSMDDIAAAGNNVWNSHPKVSVAKDASAKAAKAGKLTFIPPELATLAVSIPQGANWVHELKFDGYRTQALIENGTARLLTRTGLDWTAKFAPLPEILGGLPVKSAILDGEIVAVDVNDRINFKSLQATLSGEADAPLQYYVFDCLHLDGEDLRPLPLLERKERLEALLTKAGTDRVIYSEHFTKKGDSFHRHVCDMDMEGLISKRADAPYRSGRGKSWLKIKCHKRQEFVIGGFTLPAKGRRGIGALLVGYYDDGRLIYAGKVGTGFTVDSSMALRKRLETLAADDNPFEDVPALARRGATWVTPKLVAEVQFGEWTSDGRLRHPSFQGLRDDKPAKDVSRDYAIKTAKAETEAEQEVKVAPKTKPTAPRKSSKDAEVGGVRISHPDRIVYPGTDITKADIAEYYLSVANHILPHIAGRPISMIRCPEGIGGDCFFQRHMGLAKMANVKDSGIKVKGRRESYIMIEDAKGLISLIQWGVIEIHPWGCMAADPDRPDRMIFDLDPDPDAKWQDVIEGAVDVRDRMAEFGLESFLKTTGGKGVHVTVPITPDHDWDAIKAFTRAVAQSMEHDNPKRYIATASKAARKGKVFIDYLRNDHTATAIAPFAVRARDGATVATPIAWDELTPKLLPADFTISTVPKRLKTLKTDPWADVFKVKQSLSGQILTALGI
ncbi:DNA ligase D [Asticcacaulis endophyticus]|uniref:DNA ligase (ATP) n=1 Tax=Asticcacaulis endophyticus TaxID=1395890 RepID=A0A918Q7V3_9CAUL|nr:DNA ligase D [Asticcacaulis endophyticus]GGZ34904.1 ATP-dependent DNA ligase [Asticcacaulis endophyticus]